MVIHTICLNRPQYLVHISVERDRLRLQGKVWYALLLTATSSVQMLYRSVRFAVILVHKWIARGRLVCAYGP